MPVLTDEEVNTVRESCRQLGAIGRNLNQVARALNIEFRESDKLKQEAIEKRHCCKVSDEAAFC
ncbi:plasmid mobilization relaxosome protein MobC, partial [Shigella flexneri]